MKQLAHFHYTIYLTVGLLTATLGKALADADIAKQLANPIAGVISVPIVTDFDFNVGPNDGWRATTEVEPVIPFSLNENWNVISRTVVPVIYQNGVVTGEGEQFGLSDTEQSLFFSPKAPLPTSIGNLIWGVGPVAALPTSTDALLGGGIFGLGPTGVFLFQEGGWTYGALANHLWGVAKTRSNTPDLNSTYLQPFISYTTLNAWTFSINSELTYNWTANELSGPINAGISKVVQFGEQTVQLQAKGRYWAATQDASPEGLGFALGLTFVFPE